MKVKNVRYVCLLQPSLSLSSSNPWLPLTLTLCPTFLHLLPSLFLPLTYFGLWVNSWQWAHRNDVRNCVMHSPTIINKPLESCAAVANTRGRWGISQRHGGSRCYCLCTTCLKKHHISPRLKTEFFRWLAPRSQSGTYFQEWWASSCGASF